MQKRCPEKSCFGSQNHVVFFFFRWKALYIVFGATRLKMWEAGLLLFVFCSCSRWIYVLICHFKLLLQEKTPLPKTLGYLTYQLLSRVDLYNKLSQSSWKISQCQPHHHSDVEQKSTGWLGAKSSSPKKRCSGMKSQFLNKGATGRTVGLGLFQF